MSNKEKLYNLIYDKIDNILISQGIREVCVNCSIKKPFLLRNHYFFGDNEKGCCNGCKYLIKNGCSTKSLFCKFYLCSKQLRYKIEENEFYKKLWNRLLKMAIKHKFLVFRGNFLDCKDLSKLRYKDEFIYEVYSI